MEEQKGLLDMAACCTQYNTNDRRQEIERKTKTYKVNRQKHRRQQPDLQPLRTYTQNRSAWRDMTAQVT